MSKVKIKVNPGGIMPTQTLRSAFALDLIASGNPTVSKFPNGCCVKYETAVNVKLPKDTVMVIVPRTFTKGLDATNSGYCRGNSVNDIEVRYEFDFDVDVNKLPQKGDRVGTLFLIEIPIQNTELEIEEE